MRGALTILSLLALAGAGGSCADEAALQPLADPIFTGSIDFEGPGRVAYAKTGPDWQTPNQQVDKTLLRTGAGAIDPQGLLVPEQAEMAVYLSGTVAELTFRPSWRPDDGRAPPAGRYCVRGRLTSQAGKALDYIESCGALEPEGDGYRPFTVSATALPASTAELYQLEIVHDYEVEGHSFSRRTRQELAQLWRAPIAGTPLYRKIIRWGSMWLGGRYEDLGSGSESENAVADLLIEKMRALEDEGYSYGAFARPSPEDYTNTAEVFLDFKRSACGELRGFFLALLESQGIDGNWLLFNYNRPSTQDYSMYQTHEIAALGRDKQVWRFSNHIVVEVNGVVYDPTYLVRKQDMETYEDFMFASYCYGADEPCVRADDWCTVPDGPQKTCQNNPPGYTQGLSPPVFRGDSYD